MVDSTSSTISASRSSTIASSTRLQKVPSSSAPGRQDLGSSQATHMTYQYAMPTAYCANQPLVCKHHHSQPTKGDGFEWNVLERRIVIITGVTKKMKMQTDGKHMYHRNFSQQTSWNQLRKRQNGSWQKKTSWSTPPPSQHDDVFNVWDGRKMMSMAKNNVWERLNPVWPSIYQCIYQPLHRIHATNKHCLFSMSYYCHTQLLHCGRPASKGELSRHVVARAVVLPRLKTAYSELPPMAARWKRAHTAMMIIEEIDEKITTCAAAEWQMNSHIRPNFTQHPTNCSWEESMDKCLYVPACLAHAHMHIHRQVHW